MKKMVVKNVVYVMIVATLVAMIIRIDAQIVEELLGNTILAISLKEIRDVDKIINYFYLLF